MSRLASVILGGAVAVVLFDVVVATGARLLGFDYRMAAVGSWLLYAAIGFAAARRGGWRWAPLAGAIVGLADATLGWAASWWIGPGRLPTGTITPGEWAWIAFTVVFIAAAVAALGGLAARGRQTDRPA